MILLCPEIAYSVRPGQFVMIQIDRRLDPLLRRPFSVYKTRSDQIEIVYQIAGRGTELLSTRSTGENLQVLGPLGNGFTVKRHLDFGSLKFSKAILVAGGVGVASLMMLADELRKRKIDVIALIGAANKDRLIGVDELAEIGAEVFVATDDGSYGHHGLVTEQFSIVNFQLLIDNPTIYACGPHGMLKSVAKIALENDIPAQLSFESRMACGLGACLGCVIKVKANDRGDRSTDFEYKRVCSDGPVFNAKKVKW